MSSENSETQSTVVKLICMECSEKFTTKQPDEADPECPSCGSTDFEVDE